MKSSYWSAIGAIFIPTAMVWVLEAPREWHPFWIWMPVIIFTILGIVYLRKGWQDIVAEGEKREKEKEEMEKQEKRRRSESRAILLVLSYISRKRPVSMPRVDRILNTVKNQALKGKGIGTILDSMRKDTVKKIKKKNLNK